MTVLAILVGGIGWALLQFLWKGALLAAGAGVALALLRSARPQLRYAVAGLALALAVALPLVDTWRAVGSALAAPDWVMGAPDDAAANAAPGGLSSLARVVPWLVAAWAVGVVMMLARLLAGLWWVRQLRHRGVDLLAAGWQGRLAHLAMRLKLRQHVGLRMVDGLTGPVTVGWLRPVVLVPAALVAKMPPELLEALLAHELAHVKRMDYLVNLLQCLAESLLFFHPAVWWLSRRIRAERELIADDLAAQALGEPRQLALALERLCHLQGDASLAMAANSGDLAGRILRLVRPVRPTPGWRAALPALGAVVASLVIHAHGVTPAATSPASPTPASTAAPRPVDSAAELVMHSGSALVLDDDTGKVLLQKNAEQVMPIASISKLITAMVVLDAKPDMDARIGILRSDMDGIKHSGSMVPVGAQLPRRTVMELALMSSDNRAAHALARTYPGGQPAFDRAVRAKIAALGLSHTTILEPTGLSRRNTSTAADVAKMAAAASHYPDIGRITTGAKDTIVVRGKPVEYHNTNRFVGKDGWDIQLSKTGFTNEAGRCVTMRLKAAERHITLVLLHAPTPDQRAADVMSIRERLDALLANRG